MCDSPQPDRRSALVGLMVEVQEPEVKSQLGMRSTGNFVKSFARAIYMSRRMGKIGLSDKSLFRTK